MGGGRVMFTLTGFKQKYSIHEKAQSMQNDRLMRRHIFAFVLTILSLVLGVGFPQLSKAEKILKFNPVQDFFSLNEESGLEMLAGEDAYGPSLRFFFFKFNSAGLNIPSNPITSRYHSSSCHILSRPPPPMSTV